MLWAEKINEKYFTVLGFMSEIVSTFLSNRWKIVYSFGQIEREIVSSFGTFHNLLGLFCTVNDLKTSENTVALDVCYRCWKLAHKSCF